MATRVWFSASDIRVLLDGQELTLETYDTGDFITGFKKYVEIDKNGKLEIISGYGEDVNIQTGPDITPITSVSADSSVDINVNDFPNGIYFNIYSAPPMEEHTYTLNITGFATETLQLAPFLKDIANAIRTKKGTTATINAQNFASEIESIESGGSGSLYTYNSSNGAYDIASAQIGCIDKNGIYHEYDTNFGYSDYDLHFKMIGFIAKDILSTKTIYEISNLYNLTKDTTATATNISAGDVIILTGDAVLNWYWNDQ